jgi:3-dehydroquinate synthase
MDEVRVRLPGREYGIYIGCGVLAGLGKLAGQLGFGNRMLVISDTNVGPLYSEKALESLREAGFTAELVTVHPGEDSKSLTVAQKLFGDAIRLGLDRRSAIVALGGGVVGDLAGFIAATYLRGVPLVQVPTSLLAQVDSSVGGKVAVNHPLGKNLIGAFHQPRLVVADTAALSTLSERELSTGLAEVVKHGIIADAHFFEFLEKNHAAVMAREEAAMTRIVRRSCEIKAGVVEQDEKESHLRMILNFGHTIGHAVEAGGGFGRYSHGEAVAIGIHGACLISHYLNFCSEQTLRRICSVLESYGLPIRAQGLDQDELAVFISRDKKSLGGTISWVLLKDIGTVSVCNEVPDEVVRRALRAVT